MKGREGVVIVHPAFNHFRLGRLLGWLLDFQVILRDLAQGQATLLPSFLASLGKKPRAVNSRLTAPPVGVLVSFPYR